MTALHWCITSNPEPRDSDADDFMIELVHCGNCGRPMRVIERSITGLAVGYRCEHCDEECWPYDEPPEATP
jgi:hypothetical protein